MDKDEKVLEGNCFLCGKTAKKLLLKNHILKEHNTGDEQCYLIKAEGFYCKDYWLFFSIPLTSTLSKVDDFLRKIWCECCGHMSNFSRGGQQLSFNTKIMKLKIGDKITYQYDFGSTTTILITIVKEITRPKQKDAVQLLGRNEPFTFACDFCGKPAEQMDIWQNEYYCGKCAEKEDEYGGALPIVNSPRMGECGYDGDLDRWTFNPSNFSKQYTSLGTSKIKVSQF